MKTKKAFDGTAPAPTPYLRAFRLRFAANQATKTQKSHKPYKRKYS